jgi:hypothetical protein
MSGRGRADISGSVKSGRALAAPLLLMLLAGCSMMGNSGGGSNPAPVPAPPEAADGDNWSMRNLFTGSSAKAPQPVANAQPDVNCPPVDVRRGASTYSIGPAGDANTMTLKYQAEFVRQARTCSVVDGNMVMRIGVEGRVIVGPSGGPGQVNVPLRLAVVHETASSGMHVIATKFVLIPVTLAPGQGSALFSHVEQAMSFPLPNPTAQLDEYLIYVGFDPQAVEPQPKAPPAAHKKKPKPPQPSASAN